MNQMTHNELLYDFFSFSYEENLHLQMLLDASFAVPVDEIKQHMIALTEISLAEFFNYLDNHPSISRIKTSDITQCGSLLACTDELCEVLREVKEGKSATEIGKSEVYEKYLRAHNKSAWTRYGNQQAKTAQQLGLAFKNDHRWYLSCYGYAYAYPLLNKRRQNQFLCRVLLRNPFYAQVLSKVRLQEVQLTSFMKGLSASTQGGRSSSVTKMLQICLDEMDREGIKWHDIHIPKYSKRSKTLSDTVLKGTVTAIDNYGFNDEYFNGGVPLYTVKAACGYFVDHEVPEQEGWMDLSGSGVRTNSEDYFIVYAKGDSMLPKIKDGDLCLFKWYKGETLYDNIVLTQCRDYDSEYESSYTIKRFHNNDVVEGEPRTISLQPLNKAEYEPILLSEEDGCDYKTIGVFVKVL